MFDGKRACREYMVANLFPIGKGSKSDDEWSGSATEHSKPTVVCATIGSICIQAGILPTLGSVQWCRYGYR